MAILHGTEPISGLTHALYISSPPLYFSARNSLVAIARWTSEFHSVGIGPGALTGPNLNSPTRAGLSDSIASKFFDWPRYFLDCWKYRKLVGLVRDISNAQVPHCSRLAWRVSIEFDPTILHFCIFNVPKEEIQIPHNLACGFGGDKTMKTRCSCCSVQVWVQIHRAITPKGCFKTQSKI